MALQSMTALASITLQQASTSVSFSNIPQDYRDLVLDISARHDSSSTNTGVFARFNNDPGSYEFVFLTSRIGLTPLAGTASINNAAMGRVNNQNNTPNIAHIMDYSLTDRHKTVLAHGALSTGGTNQIAQVIFANRWVNTAAINSITLTTEDAGSFAAGSTFDLYGRIG